MIQGLLKTWLTSACAGCLIAGWVFLIAGAVSAAHTELFLRHSASTTGTVLANVPRQSEDIGTTFAPEFRYRGSDGRMYTVTSSASSTPPAFAVGERVAVRYSIERPAEARIDSFWQMWGLAVGLCLGGPACLLAGTILLLILRKRKLYKLAATDPNPA